MSSSKDRLQTCRLSKTSIVSAPIQGVFTVNRLTVILGCDGACFFFFVFFSFLKTRRHQVASDLSYEAFGRLAPSELVYLRTGVGVFLFCSLIMFQRADADYGFSKSSVIGAAERAADKLSDGRDRSPWCRPEPSRWLSSDPARFSSRLGPTQLLGVLARGVGGVSFFSCLQDSWLSVGL